jgi:iron(III) transport system permease protein
MHRQLLLDRPRFFQAVTLENCSFVLAIFFFLFLVYGPVMALLGGAAGSILANPAKAFTHVVLSQRQGGLLFQSILLAVTVAATDLFVGFLAALYLWRWRTGPGRYLRWLILLLISLPATIHVLAWHSAGLSLNSVLTPLGVPPIPLQGWVMTWWVQSMVFLPVATGLSLVGLELLDPLLIQAARLAGDDMDVVARILLPLTAPFLAAAAGFLFLFSITDYTVPSLFSVNVFSLEIYAEFSATNQPAWAFLLALPLIVLTILVLLVSQRFLRAAFQTAAWHHTEWRPAFAWPPWFERMQRSACVLLFGAVCVILVSLAAEFLSMGGRPLPLPAGEIGYTFFIGVASALLCVPVATGAGHLLTRPGRSSGLWWLLVTAPLALPAPLIGIGLITLWNTPAGYDIYGGPGMPVLAALARFVPLAAIVVCAQIRLVDPMVLDAARVFDTHPLSTLMRIRVPLLLPGILIASGLTFSLALGELAATLLVVPPGFSTLTIRIYNYLHYGATGAVAGLSLVLVGLVFLAGTVTFVLLRNRSWIESGMGG